MIETPSLTAFLDANVLYPNLLRNLLMYFGVAGFYQPRWSAQVHKEWMAALARNRPDSPFEKIERIRTLMDAKLYDTLVEGYEDRIASITLPDGDDRHILAAAIHCSATVIITANLRDFPAATLAPYGIVAENPDTFLSRLVNEDREHAVAIFRTLCQDYKKPQRSPQDITASMKRHSLTATAALLDSLLVIY